MVGTMIENSTCSTASTASTCSNTSTSTTSSSNTCAGSAPRSAASLKRAGPVAVPEEVAWLDHVTLELTTTTIGGKPHYQLTIKYAPTQQKLEAPATWTVSRTFDEYRTFQKKLMRRMQHGHSCSAECKWLYKVVKHYFPQKSLFCNSCPKVVAARRQTLFKCFTTVQASLVNRGNHSCRVLVHDVAAEFNRFVAKNLAAMASDSPASEFSAVTRDSLDSFDSEEEESDEEEGEEEESDCDACHSRHVICRTHSNVKA